MTAAPSGRIWKVDAAPNYAGVAVLDVPDYLSGNTIANISNETKITVLEVKSVGLDRTQWIRHAMGWSPVSFNNHTCIAPMPAPRFAGGAAMAGFGPPTSMTARQASMGRPTVTIRVYGIPAIIMNHQSIRSALVTVWKSDIFEENNMPVQGDGVPDYENNAIDFVLKKDWADTSFVKDRVEDSMVDMMTQMPRDLPDAMKEAIKAMITGIGVGFKGQENTSSVLDQRLKAMNSPLPTVEPMSGMGKAPSNAYNPYGSPSASGNGLRPLQVRDVERAFLTIQSSYFDMDDDRDGSDIERGVRTGTITGFVAEKSGLMIGVLLMKDLLPLDMPTNVLKQRDDWAQKYARQWLIDDFPPALHDTIRQSSFTSPLLEITDFVVAPQYRNGGVGTSVLQAALAANANKTFCAEMAMDSKAMSLYNRLGFQSARRVKVVFGVDQMKVLSTPSMRGGGMPSGF